MGVPEKIKAIEDEIGRTQINKATEHHIGLLKAKIAKLKREQEAIQIKKSSKKSDGFSVRRTGDATVVFIGLPSVGKSTLLNKLTGSRSLVGAFQFTTLTVVPGIMKHRGAHIQLLDLPGIIKGASSGKGLGKRVLSVARSADLVLLVLDVFHPNDEKVLIKELDNIGIKLNQKPPNIIIEKSSSGGISIVKQVKMTKTPEKLLKQILNVYGIISGRIVIRENVTSDQVIDYLSGNRTYTQSLTVLNKIDLVDSDFLSKFSSKMKTEFITVSAEAEINIDALKEMIYKKLDFIRIYMRPKGGKTDYKEPLIIRKGDRIADVCNTLHRRMTKEFRFAMIWGKSVKFDAQRVGLNHLLQDEDVLTIIKAKGT